MLKPFDLSHEIRNGQFAIIFNGRTIAVCPREDEAIDIIKALRYAHTNGVLE